MSHLVSSRPAGGCVGVRQHQSIAVSSCVVVIALGLTLCSACESPLLTSAEPPETASVAAPLNAAPQSRDFVILAANSVRLQQGSATQGGDIGANGLSGPFLSSGIALEVGSGVTVQATDDLIADSVQLGSASRVGDIQTNRLSGSGSRRGSVTAKVALPTLPQTRAVRPGTRDLRVMSGNTLTAGPGQYATMVVNSGGNLHLRPGIYEANNVDLGSGARVEALGPVELRIASRLKASSAVSIGGSPGMVSGAHDVRIEVSGGNGGNGSPRATPSAATLGSGSKLTALFLVPNGTLSIGSGSALTGAFFARDVEIGTGVRIGFQDGFSAECSPSCNNPCTEDDSEQSLGCHTSSGEAGLCVGSVCVAVPNFADEALPAATDDFLAGLPDVSVVPNDVLLGDGRTLEAWAAARATAPATALRSTLAVRSATMASDLATDTIASMQQCLILLTDDLGHQYAAGGPGEPQQSGLAYVWGAKSFASRRSARQSTGCCEEQLFGLDCSGMVRHCAIAASIELPVLSAEGLRASSGWAAELPSGLEIVELVPLDATGATYETGDLVFWADTESPTVAQHLGVATRHALSGLLSVLQSNGRPGCDEFGATDTAQCEENYGARRGPRSVDWRAINTWPRFLHLTVLRIVPKTASAVIRLEGEAAADASVQVKSNGTPLMSLCAAAGAGVIECTTGFDTDTAIELVAVSPSAATGASFQGWSGRDCAGAGRATSLTFARRLRGIECSATFSCPTGQSWDAQAHTCGGASPSGSIAGTILNDFTQPADVCDVPQDDSFVELALDNGNGLPEDDEIVAVSQTSALGHYEFTGLQPGSYWLFSETCERIILVDVGAGQAVRRDFCCL